MAAVIGDPIAHSLSPAIHNAAFAELGLDWIFVALPTPAGSAPRAVDAMRAMGIRGLSVTMPHKAAVIPALDDLTPVAAALGSVNCISARSGRLIGDSTDGAGFIAGLRHDFDFDPAGTSCVVLGAGGAARAVVQALAAAGAASVRVVNRTASRAEEAASLAGPVGSVGGPESVGTAELVVNATPIGMELAGSATSALPCDPQLLAPGQIVAELIYHPARTALMAAATERGCRTSNGVSMLVHQAATAFETWTGLVAPVGAMAAAVANASESSSEASGPNDPEKS